MALSEIVLLSTAGGKQRITISFIVCQSSEVPLNRQLIMRRDLKVGLFFNNLQLLGEVVHLFKPWDGVRNGVLNAPFSKSEARLLSPPMGLMFLLLFMEMLD